ncbi:MAG TPA: hypothetical protein PK313_05130 [Myxococcota bacterium]|nr:hypothetical protein [Myxococcota bacterium]
MVRRQGSWVILAALAAVAVGCEGRQVDDGFDDLGVRDTPAGQDGVIRDNGGRDPGGGYDPGIADVPPSVNAIGPIQQSDASVLCPADGSGTDPMFQNGVTGVTLDVVVVSPQWVASKDKSTGEPTRYGYMVADANLLVAEAWRGVMLAIPAELNPTPFAVGDVLTITADHADYYCNTQLSVTQVTKIGTGVVPQPLVIDPADLGSQDPDTAEPLEGVLVKVVDVAVTQTPFLGSDGNDHGGFYVTGDMVVANDFRLAYMSTGTDSRKVGDRFDHIIGVVKYSYGKYIVTPRFDADMALEGSTSEGVVNDVIELADPGPVDAIQPVNAIGPVQQADASVKCPPDGVTTEPMFQNGATNLTMSVVITSPQWTVTKDSGTGLPTKVGYMAADAGLATAEEWRGIMLSIPAELLDEELALGDVVRVTADHADYYCNTQLSVKSLTVLGSGNVPAPLVIDPAELGSQDKATAEALEGVLVTVLDVEVTQTPFLGSDGKDHGGFHVTGNLVVANDFGLAYMNKATDARTVGDRFDSITGVVKYTFGKYVLLPRFDADLDFEGGTTEDVIEPTDPGPTDPGPTDPGVTDPGPTDPGVTDPGPTDPGITDPGTDPGTPTGTTVKSLQMSADSTGCTANAFNTIASGLTFADLVVVSPQYSASGSLHGYFVVDAASVANPESAGALMVVNKSLATAFVPGDVISVTGNHVEYYCLTEVSATAAAKKGTASVPAPIVLDAALLANGGTAGALEKYEGNIVRLENVSVTAITSSDGVSQGWFRVGTGVEVLSDFFYPIETAPYTPVLDDTFTSLTGALKYHYGKYRIVPRDAADFVRAR